MGDTLNNTHCHSFFLDETFIFTVDMNPWSEEKVRLVAFANLKFSVLTLLVLPPGLPSPN